MHSQYRPFIAQLFLDFYAIFFPRWLLIFFSQHDSPSNLAESWYPRHEPRSRAFYYSINSLLQTWNSYSTEPPRKYLLRPTAWNLAITHHHQLLFLWAAFLLLIANAILGGVCSRFGSASGWRETEADSPASVHSAVCEGNEQIDYRKWDRATVLT